MGTESVDLIDAWHDLYVMLGTSSAALIGLLFIATSIHLGEVVSNPGFRVRSYNQTLYLLTLLVEAVLILVPQPVPFLGVELMALNLVGLGIAISTTYTFIYKHRNDRHRRYEDVPRDSINCRLSPRNSRWHRPHPGLSVGNVHCDSFVHGASRHGRVGCLVDHDRHGAKGIGCRAKGKGRQLIPCPLLTQSGHRAHHTIDLLLVDTREQEPGPSGRVLCFWEASAFPLCMSASGT